MLRIFHLVVSVHVEKFESHWTYDGGILYWVKIFSPTSHGDSKGGMEYLVSILTLTFDITRTAELLAVRAGRT